MPVSDPLVAGWRSVTKAQRTGGYWANLLAHHPTHGETWRFVSRTLSHEVRHVVATDGVTQVVVT